VLAGGETSGVAVHVPRKEETVLSRIPRVCRSIILFCIFAAGLSGCAISLGGGDEDAIHKQTLGRQLMDLKDARDRGAMSDKEYQKEKAKLLRSVGMTVPRESPQAADSPPAADVPKPEKPEGGKAAP